MWHFRKQQYPNPSIEGLQGLFHKVAVTKHIFNPDRWVHSTYNKLATLRDFRTIQFLMKMHYFINKSLTSNNEKTIIYYHHSTNSEYSSWSYLRYTIWQPSTSLSFCMLVHEDTQLKFLGPPKTTFLSTNRDIQLQTFDSTNLSCQP